MNRYISVRLNALIKGVSFIFDKHPRNGFDPFLPGKVMLSVKCARVCVPENCRMICPSQLHGREFFFPNGTVLQVPQYVNQSYKTSSYRL